MHRLTIDVNESNSDKIIKNEVLDMTGSKKDCIDFSKFNVEAFKDIGDPAAWQKEQRSEWDR